MENDTQELAQLLTDDRQDSDLLAFERTWGHRMLAGVCIGMLVSALVLIVYCGYRLVSLAAVLGTAGLFATAIPVLYITVIVLSVLVVPPAIAGIVVAKRPRWALVAVIAPFAAFALLVAFAVYGLGVAAAQPFSIALYICIGAVFPVLYLIAALKVFFSR